MATKGNILIVDDDKELGQSLIDILSYEGYTCLWVGNGYDAIQAVQQDSYHIVLMDLLLPSINGLETMYQMQKIDPSIIVIMMSGIGTIQDAIKATRMGAYDWIEKPLESERVLITIRNALEKSQLIQEKELLLADAKERYKMVGASPAMKKIFNLIDKVSPQNVTVMITGESGTGKDLIAHAIHLNSSRATKPFVQVNCAAIPETLIESELFGHTKGAFTGAVNDKQGKFHAANTGTIFLDEIGDLSQPAQAKVLRTLESGQVEQVGSSSPIEVNVRIICATNKDLQTMMNNGEFREDLYHRIFVIHIHIPPLRERKEDIMPLMNHFLDYYTSGDQPVKTITPDGETFLLSYEWPGNVRELRNLTEKANILIETPEINRQQLVSLLEYSGLSKKKNTSNSFQEAKKEFEKKFIYQALKKHNWNITQTAKHINMPRSLVYNKINEFGLKQTSKK